jgi:tetrahydromethanopterin S-methyltransferase subunit G
VDERFDRVDEKFGEMNRRFDKLDHESARVNDRLDDLIKVVIAGFIGITGGIIAGFAAIVALIATQL